MKSLQKDILIEKGQIENTLFEKQLLQSIDYPLLCGLVFCFQNEERIFFIMPFLAGGELFQHLRKFKTFDEEKVRFYGAQIALGLEYLHSKGIVYRDLKPENILMDDKGYLRLVDFGMSKKLGESIIVLASDKTVAVKVSDSFVKKGVNAGKIVGEISRATGANGGGRPNFAQGCIKDASKLDEILPQIEAELIKQ